MLFYLGTALSRAVEGNLASAMLASAGHQRTYDWSGETEARYAEPENMGPIAQAELDGIKRAHFSIFLLPGGRGTHCEAGASLILSKPTFFCSKPGTGFFDMGAETSAFYWHENAIRIEAETLEEQIDLVLDRLPVMNFRLKAGLPKCFVSCFDCRNEPEFDSSNKAAGCKSRKDLLSIRKIHGTDGSVIYLALQTNKREKIVEACPGFEPKPGMNPWTSGCMPCGSCLSRNIRHVQDFPGQDWFSCIDCGNAAAAHADPRVALAFWNYEQSAITAAKMWGLSRPAKG